MCCLWPAKNYATSLVLAIGRVMLLNIFPSCIAWNCCLIDYLITIMNDQIEATSLVEEHRMMPVCSLFFMGPVN